VGCQLIPGLSLLEHYEDNSFLFEEK